MQITYKFRVYPSVKQTKEICRQLEICRQIYNKTLDRKIQAYKDNKQNLSLYELQKELTSWKKDNTEFGIVHSQVIQATQERVDLAFKGFFRRLKTSKGGEALGFPKEKAEGRFRSLIYPQSGFKFLSKHIQLSKIGKIKAIFHRPIEGKIKRVSLVKYPSGKFFICISSEIQLVAKPPTEGKSVGIDLGCTHFAVLSDGQVFDSPKHLRKAKGELARKQSKGQSLRLAKLHEKVANRRTDFSHKLANKLVKDFNFIAVEDLNVKDISNKKKGFSKDFRKAISDNGWSTFINLLQYKAVIAGKQVVLVDPAFTSQTCSRCGIRKKMSLDNRSYHCEACGLLLDRDLNASLNILRLGTQSLGVNP